jgi:hypothetical protein
MAHELAIALQQPGRIRQRSNPSDAAFVEEIGFGDLSFTLAWEHDARLS